MADGPSQRSLPREEGHRAGAESVRRISPGGYRAFQSLPHHLCVLFRELAQAWPGSGPSHASCALSSQQREGGTRRQGSSRRIHRRSLGPRSGRPGSHVRHGTRDGGRKPHSRSRWPSNYGARDEIVRAARALATDCITGGLEPGMLDEEGFARHLDTSTLPDPDLIIRTGGEQRLSNFLAWQGGLCGVGVSGCAMVRSSAATILEAAVSEFHRPGPAIRRCHHLLNDAPRKWSGGCSRPPCWAAVRGAHHPTWWHVVCPAGTGPCRSAASRMAPSLRHPGISLLRRCDHCRLDRHRLAGESGDGSLRPHRRHGRRRLLSPGEEA